MTRFGGAAEAMRWIRREKTLEPVCFAAFQRKGRQGVVEMSFEALCGPRRLDSRPRCVPRGEGPPQAALTRQQA